MNMKRQCILPIGTTTQAMLVLLVMAVLLSSGFVQATKIKSIQGRIVKNWHPPASLGNPHESRYAATATTGGGDGGGGIMTKDLAATLSRNFHPRHPATAIRGGGGATTTTKNHAASPSGKPHPRYAATTIRSGDGETITTKDHAATPSRNTHPRHAATTKRGGGRATITTQEPTPEAPGYPCTSFPQGAKWSLKKAPPKKSLILLPVPQNRTAAAWILNLIELTHWAAFPLGFYVAHFIFESAPTIERAVDDDSSRVFIIVLGLLCQVFGGGISGGMKHLYEGWQVAPFRNPVQLNPPGQNFPVEECNNAWLRSVAYQVHFTFQTLGLGLFTMGVFGFTAWTKALVGGSTAIALLGPKEPRLSSTRVVNGQHRPVLPLSKSLAKVFAINLVVNVVANLWLFAFVLDDNMPKLYGNVEILACFVSVAPTLLITAAGIIEGWFSDTTFNQWHHLIASLATLSGLASSLLLYQRFVAFMHQG